MNEQAVSEAPLERVLTEVYRHRETGGEFALICRASMEADQTPVIVARSLITGMNRVFTFEQFNDGSYEHMGRREVCVPVAVNGLMYRHKKTGGIYRVACDAKLSGAETPVVVYLSLATTTFWVRSSAEFYDGRFEFVEVAA